MEKKHNQTILVLILIAMLAGYLAYTFERRAEEPSFARQTKTAQQDKSFFTIPELEIRFEEPDDLTDLEYSLSEVTKSKENPQSIVYFSAKSITDKAKELNDQDAILNCTAKSGPLGALTTIYLFPNDGERPLPPETRVIGRLYVSYNGPQAACTSNPAIQEIISKKTESLRSALAGLETVSGTEGKQLEQGRIEGSLIPPAGSTVSQMQVCAVNNSTKENFCTGLQSIVDKRFKNGYGYEITVPAGQYHVYATLSKNPRDPNAYRAYYSQYVKCVGELPPKSKEIESCKDHTPIAVEVKDKETSANIEPFDWSNTGDKELLSDIKRILSRTVADR
jgi:hypothetical protein